MIYPDPTSAVAEAVVNWVAGAAAKSHKYTINGYTVSFKAHRYYGLIGVGATVLGLAALLLIPDFIAACVLGGIFGILGVLIMLYGFVMKLSLSPEKITYRGPFGRKKQLLWAHITGFGIASQYGDILVSGPAGNIRIFGYLDGYAVIKMLLRSRFPFEAATVHSETDAHGDVFHPRRGLAVTFLCLALLLLAELVGSVMGILPSSPFRIAFISVTALAGLIVALDFLCTQLYVDDSGLSYRRLYSQKSMRWAEIESVDLSMDPNSRETICLHTAGTSIKINANWKDYRRIRDMVLERSPDAALPGWINM